MEILSSHLLALLAQTQPGPATTRIRQFIDQTNRLRSDLTLRWMVGSEVPADAGQPLGIIQLEDVKGQVVLESCPECFGEAEIAALRRAVQVLGQLALLAPQSQRPSGKSFPERNECQRICQQFPDFYIVTDAQGRILECSEGFALQVNSRPAALSGQRLKEVLLDNHEQDLLAASAADVFTSGKPFRGDFEFRSSRGPLTVEFLISPMPDDSGRLYGVLMLGREMTECRRRERALQERIGQAEAAGRAKDEFLSLLSHELRTPLTPIVAGIDSMKGILSTHPQISGELAIVERNVQTEVRLIDDLLDLARITKGGLSLRLDTIDAQQILEDAVAACANEMGAKRITLRRELSAATTLIRADAGRLKQVFWHLLRNAAKFTPIGGTVTIETSNDSSLSDAAPTLVCKVIDTGLGIDRSRLPRLFDGMESLGQSRPGSGVGGGLGVGLMIARSVVRLHGGSLEAFSEGRGKGATFTVRLQTTQLQTPAAEIKQPRRSFRALRILLVEDHHDTARILAKLLDAMGHRTTIAGSLAEANKAGEEGEFDVLVSDIGLPDGSGHQLGAMLSKHPRMKGIVVSGLGSEQDIRNSIAAGFAVHLTKPVDLQVLRRHIQGIAEMV